MRRPKRSAPPKPFPKAHLETTHDGLAMLVQGVLRQDPFSGNLFVFRGRKAYLIKIVFWDGTGLCLFTKQLGHGVFLWTSNVDPGGTLMLNSAQVLQPSWKETVGRKARATRT